MEQRMENIPLTFLLGFFVTIVVDRWRNIFANIGFVDSVAFYISNYVNGTDEETRIVKRNMVRYLCLTQVLILRDISIKVRKRFPNLDAVVDAGFMQQHEKDSFDKIENDYAKYWIPLNWTFALANECRLQDKIKGDVLLNGLFNEIRMFYGNLQTLRNYDWVPIPLAYPQVVFVVVRLYFVLCVVTRQYIINEDADNLTNIDLWLPFMTQLQFIFYMGWLKVAEALLNPLGEDDDDFECNFIIDRNITIALAVVDQMPADIPEQRRDNFDPQTIPLYSEKAANVPDKPYIGSAAKQGVEDEKKRVKMVPRKSTLENGGGGTRNGSVTTSNIGRRIKESFNTRKRFWTMQKPESGNAKNNDGLRPPVWYDNKRYSSSTCEATNATETNANNRNFEINVESFEHRRQSRDSI
uniref:Bestrophin homolog n=1 Tax=Panagrolaimus sp. ES5 TaxID=591445 RepID=A0AC34FGZ0_9BILA